MQNSKHKSTSGIPRRTGELLAALHGKDFAVTTTPAIYSCRNPGIDNAEGRALCPKTKTYSQLDAIAGKAQGTQ